ncbi:MAG: 3-methyladenine DNA glycosylase AlkD [Pirellulaceae bacterium]|jgi:3-methyladenine DNA glycosylase AlkD
MTTATAVMTQLKEKGTEKTRKMYWKHGAPENLFGVSIADMKTIAKKLKGQQNLALELYETGNGDAMYLAGMVADGSQMTKRQLQSWASKSTWSMISEYTIPWLTVESKHGRDLALKWIDSKKESVACSGWTTYSGLLAVRGDEDLDLAEIKSLLRRVVDEIDNAPNYVRYTMNGFVIAVGSYVQPLLKQAKAAAKKLGKVDVNMEGTACKVPDAIEYIVKVEKMNRVGRKRKTIRC